MRIYIHSGNHGNHAGISDTVMFLKNALQDCGYTACISHKLMPGYVNILLEHFVDTNALHSLMAARRAGARYILIGTEPIINGTFNGGIESQHWHYSNSKYWKLRFEYFLIAASLADAVWVLAESMVPGYNECLQSQSVRFLPHGYVSDFATVRQRPEAQRDIDFFFSGTLTEYRQRIVDSLAQHHTVVRHSSSTPEYLRQDHMSRAKVCLSLRLSPNNEIPSVSRMHFHLQNRSFLLHESYALPSPLDAFVTSVPSKEIVEWARAALELTNRREIAESGHALFKSTLPMSRLLPPLMDEALSAMAPLQKTA
jgi:hypothetical protein